MIAVMKNIGTQWRQSSILWRTTQLKERSVRQLFCSAEDTFSAAVLFFCSSGGAVVRVDFPPFRQAPAGVDASPHREHRLEPHRVFDGRTLASPLCRRRHKHSFIAVTLLRSHMSAKDIAEQRSNGQNKSSPQFVKCIVKRGE